MVLIVGISLGYCWVKYLPPPAWYEYQLVQSEFALFLQKVTIIISRPKGI